MRFKKMQNNTDLLCLLLLKEEDFRKELESF